MSEQIKVGITHGDINGVGYEILLKTFADERMQELFIPVI
ncbi:MAG TPA: 4-hydroxythreonine-4-phosphate dehydrogenase PdxA, partial [Petrimonas sp.]|nr:4-hydroxythreonine-4-phosphate dehydrogenase PdxA [Petrimonas sp.]